MNDWQHALAGAPWLAHTTKSVELGTAQPWNRPPIPSLPQLSQLLQAARVTPLVLNGVPQELLAWDLPDGTTTGWLCPQRSPVAPPDSAQQVPDVLHDLWQVTGGSADRWNDPESWISSHYARS